MTTTTSSTHASCDIYAVVIDDHAEVDGGGRLRVCGTGGRSQLSSVYTATSSTVKVVVHRVVTADDDDDDASGYNFLLKYEGQSTSTDHVVYSINICTVTADSCLFVNMILISDWLAVYLSGRTSVSDRQTFTGLHLTCS